MVSEEELRASVARMEARLAALAKSGALMVLQALAKARERTSALVNIDVGDLAAATAFYCEALGFGVGRRFGNAALELVGASAVIYLLAKPAGSPPARSIVQRRDYARHWTPVHVDFVVPDVASAVARVRRAGAVLEGETETHKWGRIAPMADPFGNGFCLVQFLGRGYDEIADYEDLEKP